MDNKEILEKNGGKKIDICLMNPPYGSVGGDTLHLRFVEKCLDLANKQVAIFPFGFVTKVNQKSANNYKIKFDKYLIDIEEIDSNIFNIKSGSIGIYEFDINKKESDNINIKKLNGKLQIIKSLMDISEFDNYEQKFIKYLENQGTQKIMCSRGAFMFNDDKYESNKTKKVKELCTGNFAVLITNDTNGGMNGTFMSSRVGQIFTSWDDLVYFLSHRKPIYNLIFFKSKKEAENCKIALQHPLLRFTCYRTQNNQHMNFERVYKYIPDIDWSDDRVKTDEGLLEVCGCPKDKCKEYADYCKKIIDKVDNK